MSYSWILPNRGAEPAGYSSRVRDKMTDQQRAELIRRAQLAIETQTRADDALRERDEYMIELSDAGIGDTEIGRHIPGDGPDGGLNRTTVYRIVNNHTKREAKAKRERAAQR